MASSSKKNSRHFFSQHFLYSLMVGSSSLLYNIFTTFVQFFYSDYVKLPAHLVGRMWFLFGLWNTANDAFAGGIADNYKNKHGKRKRLIALLLVPTLICFFLIWLPKAGILSTTKLLLYFLIIISVFDIFFSFVDVNINALMPEIFVGIKDRAKTASLRSMLVMAFIAIGAGTAPFIFGNFGWLVFALTIVIVAGVLYFFSLKSLHETREIEPPETKSNFFEELKTILKKTYVVNFLVLYFCIRFLLSSIVTILPFYSKYVLKLPDSKSGIVLGIALGLSVLATPVWEKVSVKYGVKKTMIISLLLTLVIAPLVLLDLGLIVSISIIGLATGVFTGSQIVSTVMNADVADRLRKESNKNRNGLLYGLAGITNRFPPAIAGLLLGEILALSGYNPELDISGQPPTVELYLRLLIVTLFFVSVGISLFYAYKYKENP